MIANKILNCVYTITLSGDTCNSVMPDSKDLNINRIKIHSELLNNDIEAYNELLFSLGKIKDQIGSAENELTEFNPEFYPTLNVNNLEFDAVTKVTPTDKGTELLTTSPSRVFDENGDFKNIRVKLDYPNGSIAANVISDPEKYLLIKQEAALSDKFSIDKNTKSVEIH